MPVNRRELLASLAAVSVSAALPRLSWSQSSTSGLRINADRLRESLEGLSLYGRPAGGTFADGVSRTGFSDADVAGRNYVMQRMRGFGLEPRVDAAGNIF
ncbi:MAG TPA: hypothetical protein VH744_00685, partial [Terriglobales bacterium]